MFDSWGRLVDAIGNRAGLVYNHLMGNVIINRGRGPEIQGTRVTVYRVMDYIRAGTRPIASPRSLICAEQVQAALEYINSHRAEVDAEYEVILKRVSQPNPDWVEAGSAKSWDELRGRIKARSHKGPAMLLTSDNDVVGAVLVIRRILESADYAAWLEILNDAFTDFESLGLARDASDRVVWQTCQAADVVLITGNRSGDRIRWTKSFSNSRPG